MAFGNGRPFTLWRESELPEEWSNRLSPLSEGHARAAAEFGVPASRIECYTVVEMPDFPWSWAYQRWHNTMLESDTSLDKPVFIMVVARESFRDAPPAEREVLFRQSLRAILDTGRPAPLWSRVWSLRPEHGTAGR
jgi:hypothetical protein